MKTWYLNVSTRVLDACTIIGCLNPCSYADWDNLQVYFVNDRLHVWCKTRCRMHSIAWADTVMCRVSSRVVMCRQGSHSPLSPKCEIIPPVSRPDHHHYLVTDAGVGAGMVSINNSTSIIQHGPVSSTTKQGHGHHHHHWYTGVWEILKNTISMTAK